MRKGFVRSLVLATLAAMLGGCAASNDNADRSSGGASDASTKEVVKLRMAIVAGNDEMPGWNGIVDAFNRSHPDIQVELEQLPGGWEEYNQKINAQIAVGDAPDIGRLGVAFVSQYVSKGLLEDLSPYVNQLDMSQYYEEAFDQYWEGDHIYGIPTGIYSLGLYYNKDLFDKAGIPYPPLDWNDTWTWEQWRNTMQSLTVGDGATKQYGGYVDMHPERSLSYIYSAGGGFLNEEKNAAVINSPESKEALTFLASLIRDGYAPTPAETQVMPVSEMFKTGRMAMMVDGLWMMPSMAKIDGFKWGVAPIPGKNGQGTTINYVDSYVVFKGTKHPEEAWEVLKFFQSEEAENILIDNNLGGIPTLKSIVDKRGKDMFNPLSAEEKAVWFDSVDHSRPLPFTPNWSELMDVAMKSFDLVGMKKMEAGAAADKVAEDINKLLQQ